MTVGTTVEASRNATGVTSYDIAEFRGAGMPRHTNIHAGGGMSALFQQAPLERAANVEITVPETAAAVLLTRLRVPCAQPARIAGRPMRLQASSGFHIFLPARTDSWWACDQRTLDGWFHLHFRADLLTAAALDYEQHLDQLLVQHDGPLSTLVGHAKALTDAGQRPTPLVWDSLAAVVLHRIAVLMKRQQAMVARPSGLAGWQVRRVCDFLHEHFAEGISLSDLAALVDLSPFHFARAFKASVGVPPHRYQMMLRMEHAQGLLLNRALGIAEVAQAVGFESASSFARSFRRETGSSPGAFRRDMDAPSA